MAARLREKYETDIVPSLQKEFNFVNSMQIPRLNKIVVNMGVGEAVQDAKNMDGALGDMTVIAGQKPSIRRSRKSISNFKLRAGMPVGCKVTLRGERMYEFMDRLLNFAIPRIRDFRGVPDRAFD